MTTQTIRLEGRFVINNRIIISRKARKDHRCYECDTLIKSGSRYYCAYIGGAGLGNLKFPDRLHEECLGGYLGLVS